MDTLLFGEPYVMLSLKYTHSCVFKSSSQSVHMERYIWYGWISFDKHFKFKMLHIIVVLIC